MMIKISELPLSSNRKKIRKQSIAPIQISALNTIHSETDIGFSNVEKKKKWPIVNFLF